MIQEQKISEQVISMNMDDSQNYKGEWKKIK